MHWTRHVAVAPKVGRRLPDPSTTVCGPDTSAPSYFQAAWHPPGSYVPHMSCTKAANRQVRQCCPTPSETAPAVCTLRSGLDVPTISMGSRQYDPTDKPPPSGQGIPCDHKWGI